MIKMFGTVGATGVFPASLARVLFCTFASVHPITVDGSRTIPFSVPVNVIVVSLIYAFVSGEGVCAFMFSEVN